MPLVPGVFRMLQRPHLPAIHPYPFRVHRTLHPNVQVVRMICRCGCRRPRPARGVSFMAEHSDEHERTLAFAEIALGQIKALRQPALPRNYEIWYTYATGYNQTLNNTINEALAQHGSLSQAALDQIYKDHLFPALLTDPLG